MQVNGKKNNIKNIFNEIVLAFIY